MDFRRVFFGLALGALLAHSAPLSGQEPAEFSDGERLFTLEIQRILTEKCVGCHGVDPKTGEEAFKGGLDLRSLDATLRGGESIDHVLTPGDPKKSFLLKAVRWEDPDYEMPPKENDRLTAEQIESLETWIAAGAPWPDETTQSAILQMERQRQVTEDGALVETSGGLSDSWTYRRYQPEDLWAFQPVAKPSVPREDAHPIDAFLESKRRQSAIEPAPQAGPRELIRRATYDLTGLPPTADEVSAFERAFAEDDEAAWTTLLDRLLSSDRYGERWAQHWLDVARYADTGGMSNDYERSNAWRFRDYVIRSLNQDKPFNQFVVEQIAGDELADASLRRRLPDWDAYQDARESGAEYNEQEREWLVASSFLRMGPWDPAMVKAPEARQLYIDDVVNAVGQTFLSINMSCFKCHDHKFDPLPTRDYYRFYASFAGAQLAERPVPFHPDESQIGFEEGEAQARRLLTFAEERRNALYEKRENAAREWYQKNGKEYVSHEDRKDLPDDEKPPRHVGLSPEEQGRLKVREQDAWIWRRRLERYQPLAQTVYNGPDPKFLNARKLRMNARANQEWRPDSRILSGGALEAPGESVTPGVLSALGIATAPQGTDPYQLPDDLDGRRTGLAQWIANPENPLTARSIVNRVWQGHFGKGLAGNPNNFGAKGAKPTHPELLDWLTRDFIEHGWSLKRLHQQIMTSNAYRMDTSHPQAETLANQDPDNQLMAVFQPRRLSAEEIRDSMLAVSGELNTAMGGPPAMPEINMEVALQPRMIQFSLAPAYLPNRTPEARNRRSIYAYRVRGMADPFLESFNQPSPNDSCEQRDATSVSTQAFALLNSSVVNARALAFAIQVARETEDPADQATRAMRRALGRDPSAGETASLVSYLEEMRAYHRNVDPEPTVYPTKITRSLVEEFTGEPFEYEEILPVFENYVPDAQAADAPPETRALADLCLLLFNSNEFFYVY